MAEALTAKQRLSDVRAMSTMAHDRMWQEVLDFVEKRPHLLSERLVKLPGRDASHVGQPLLQAVIASAQPNLVVLQKLIDLGAPIEGRGRDGRTPLAEAICHPNLQDQQLPVCRLLMDNGARRDTVGNNKLSPIVEVFGEVDPEIARAMIAGGAPLNQVDGNGTPSISRMTQGIKTFFQDPRQRINVIQMIDAGAQLNPPVRVLEDLPLVSALQKGDLELADRMVDGGAVWSGRWDEGRTFMHVANSAPMVRWVMAKDERLLNAPDSRGKSPLCHLVDRLDTEWDESNDVGREDRIRDLIETFKLMVSSGAELDHQDDQGALSRSPRERIGSRKSADLKAFMLSWGTYEAAQQALSEMGSSLNASP